MKAQAVLFRAAHHSDHLEVELARRNIPFVKYGGLKFMEAAHVKDTLACLRVLENPFDEVSWFRVLQLLEGMGPASARRLMDDLEVRRTDDAVAASPLARFLAEPLAVPKGAAQGIRDLRSVLGDCLEAEALPPAAQIARLRTFLEPVIARKYDAAGARARDLDQLELLASESASRGQFLADLTLDPPSSTGDLAGPPHLDEDYLVLSTIHSAKGLEWDVVHVIHAADGMIPSDMSTGDDDEIEEERRLLYVALTRARDALHVTYPQRYYRRPRGLEDRPLLLAAVAVPPGRHPRPVRGRRPPGRLGCRRPRARHRGRRRGRVPRRSLGRLNPSPRRSVILSVAEGPRRSRRGREAPCPNPAPSFAVLTAGRPCRSGLLASPPAAQAVRPDHGHDHRRRRAAGPGRPRRDRDRLVHVQSAGCGEVCWDIEVSGITCPLDRRPHPPWHRDDRGTARGLPDPGGPTDADGMPRRVRDRRSDARSRIGPPSRGLLRERPHRSDFPAGAPASQLG